MEPDSRSGGQYETEVYGLLEHAVHEELTVSFILEGFVVEDAALENLASAVVDRIDSAFRFRWDPRSTSEGSHQWKEDGHTYSRCTTCLATSPPSTSTEAAKVWYDDHALAAHTDRRA